MSASEHPRTSPSPPRSRRLGLLGATVGAIAATASFAAFAIASSTTTTVGSAANATLGESVAVNAHGHTLYALSPETARHLLCRSRECLRFWPPLTVGSGASRLKAGAGLHGHLGILRRSATLFQVTLNGMPLYRFSGDRGKDEARGQGIESFGGRWHAVVAGGAVTPTRSGGTPEAPTNSPTMPGYPAY